MEKPGLVVFGDVRYAARRTFSSCSSRTIFSNAARSFDMQIYSCSHLERRLRQAPRQDDVTQYHSDRRKFACELESLRVSSQVRIRF